MATSDGLDILTPKSLILPVVIPSTQSNPVAGTIVLSGTTIAFYNGSAWMAVTAA